jgi:hypothetical protein
MGLYKHIKTHENIINIKGNKLAAQLAASQEGLSLMIE